MILMRYFTKLFVTRFLAVLLALSALVELLSMLDALRHLVGHHHHHSFKLVMTFTALQFPMALEQLFLLAVLIGAVLTFRALAQSSEMIVLRSCGMSPYRLLGSLLPVGLVLSLSYYAIVDHFAPAAERSFAIWWHDVIQAADEDEDTPKGAIWLRDGSEVIAVQKVENDGRHLVGLTRYLRDDSGILVGRVEAKTADYQKPDWVMTDVTRVDLRNHSAVGKSSALMPAAVLQPKMLWQGGPSAKNVEELAVPTRRMQASEGRQVLAGTWSGSAGAAHYRTLVQKSYLAPLLPFLMLLLAVPALAGTGRRQTVRGMVVSIGTGLLFLVANGFFSSMSEAAVLPPVVAVWTAPFCFFAFGFFLLLKNEE
ncbi:MAG: LptF/LptG family permease [Rhizomicrobium sp.]